MAVGALAVLAAVGTLIALNWEPEEKLGNVDAPRFDSTLAGGGLSSRELGSALLVDSLESSAPIGYQILVDAANEDVVDEFQEVTPSGAWTSAYEMEGGDFRLLVAADKRIVLRYPTAKESTSDRIFDIARRYGYYTGDVSSALKSLEDRTTALLDQFDARPLTVGVPESDLAAGASVLASEWDAWIQSYGENPLEARVAEARRQVLLVVEDVANDPTNPGLHEYDSAIRRLNQAVDAYNASL